ncbi:MAG: phosphoribosylaminoimidazolesuccinocarboxamide synthase [Myxococcales bacterium]|nr:phosphoribosylaminoimidazolesuccinocarboxamide synthase [Myxococcales bacterium]
MISDQTLRSLLPRTLESTDLTIPGAERYVGKVRDNYTVGARRTIVVTDRISAFDVVLGTIPLKGQVLNRMAAWWFEETKRIAPNHLIDVPDPSVMVAIACAPLPVEMVMRAYLTGVTTTSVWHHYQRGVRTFCGHALPDGMKKNQALPAPILTPSTKAEKGGHDVSASREEILALCRESGSLDAATFDEAATMAQELFAFGQERALKRGLILVDTKYEFGRAPDGRILVIDEIHTPDSSRYWHADDFAARIAAGEEPRALDKEYVRRWYAAQGYTGEGPPPPLADEVRIEAAKRYIAACELITGREFIGDTEDPDARIRRNLGIEKR